MDVTDEAKLKTLAEGEGMTIDEFCRHFFLKSLVPAICMNARCGYIEPLEPDQDAGWCAECDAGTMKSGMVLAGLI